MYSPPGNSGPPNAPAKLIGCRRRLLGRHAGPAACRSQSLLVSTPSRHPYLVNSDSLGPTATRLSKPRFQLFRWHANRKSCGSDLTRRTRALASSRADDRLPAARFAGILPIRKLRWRDTRIVMHKLNMPAYRPNAAIILRNSSGKSSSASAVIGGVAGSFRKEE